MEEQDGAELLAQGKAFVDLSYWRKVAVTGADAFTWLNDLVSSDISDLVPGRAKQALLLSPTGRIRAMFTVAVPEQTIVLLQDPSQPSPVDDILSRYVLSSDVQLVDRTDELGLFAFPGLTVPPDVPGAAFSAPSCLGDGVDLISQGEGHDRLAAALSGTCRSGPASTIWCRTARAATWARRRWPRSGTWAIRAGWSWRSRRTAWRRR